LFTFGKFWNLLEKAGEFKLEFGFEFEFGIGIELDLNLD
jgi:hypothetical protein